MAKAAKKQVERIKDFNSIAEYEASTAREGEVDTPIFDGQQIRRVIHNGEAYYSVVDVVAVLSETQGVDVGGYWRQLKKRLIDEGADQAVTNCNGLKLPAHDGKLRVTDCANIETLLRIIQSIPSKRAEPFKKWLAQVGFERIQETAEPSRAIERGIEAYRKKRYDDGWINDRLKNIAAYNEKVSNWGQRGVGDPKEFAKLNAEMTKTAFGVTPAQYADIKGVEQKKRKDYMTRIELQIDTLADTAAVEIMESRNTKLYAETRKASLDGAGVAAAARLALEKQTGRRVVTKENALPKQAASQLPSKKGPDADMMAAWFRAEHGLAVEQSPYDGGEGGYVYPIEEDIHGVLQAQFPESSSSQIDRAAEMLHDEGPWLTREFTNALDEDRLRDND